MPEPHSAISPTSGLPSVWSGTVDAVREAAAEIALAKVNIGVDGVQLAHQLDMAVEELRTVEEEIAVELAELETAVNEGERERRLALHMMGRLPIPVLTTNADGAVLEANDAALDLLGLGARELRRKPVFAFMEGDARRCGRTLLAAALRARNAVEDRLLVRSRTGAHVPCQVTLVPGTAADFDAEAPAGRPGESAAGAAAGSSYPEPKSARQPARIIRWLLKPLPPDDRPDAAAFRAAVLELCGLGIADGDLRSQLHRVAELASEGIPDADAASVVLGNPAEPELLATSSTLAQGGDGVQHLAASGPTFEAYRFDHVVGSGDLSTDHRFASLARSPGVAEVHGCLALPLVVEGGTAGVLTLYARAKDSLDGEATIEFASLFVAAAQALIRDARQLAEVTKVRDQLEEALKYRSVIEQAKGMIMMARGCTADEAFAVLVRMSNVRNTKLREVAQQFVASGGRLDRRPPSSRPPSSPVSPSTDRVRPYRPDRPDRPDRSRSSRSAPRRPPVPPAVAD